jgi:hypothetical protein
MNANEREIDRKRRDAARSIVAGRRLGWDAELALEHLRHHPDSPEAIALREWAARKRAKAG